MKGCAKDCILHTWEEHEAYRRGYKSGRRGDLAHRCPYGRRATSRDYWMKGWATGFRIWNEKNPTIPLEPGHWVVTELKTIPVSTGKVLDVRTVPSGVYAKVRKRYGRRCDWSEWYPANELRNLGAREDLDKAYG